VFPAGVVDIDGVLYAPDQAKISVFDRGLLYGDSAFEVMRTYGGRPFGERAHLERLGRSCERLQIGLQPGLQALQLRIARAIAQSGQSECYLRVVVTRGVGPLGLDLGGGYPPCVVIYALELHTPPEQVYEQGIAVGLVHTLRAVDGTPAAGAKSSNYLASMLALDLVKQRGAQEAVILGVRGEIVEGATSNLFVVHKGRLATPPASAGILEGITRRTVFELAQAAGMTCDERELSTDDLYDADEAFITSSIREIVPVVRAEDRMIGSGQPGPVYRALLAAYRERARR
jgi:branched-chain amino acid aminotransferase